LRPPVIPALTFLRPSRRAAECRFRVISTLVCVGLASAKAAVERHAQSYAATLAGAERGHDRMTYHPGRRRLAGARSRRRGPTFGVPLHLAGAGAARGLEGPGAPADAWRERHHERP